MITSFEDKSPTVHPSAFVAASALVLGDVSLEANASIWYGTIVRGDVHRIRIGEQTNIQDRCVVHVTTGRHATEIGNRVTAGHGAILHGCTIEDEVLVGIAATVLDGVVVERGSVVAAGALLPPGKRYGAGSLIVGSPGRVARQVTEKEQAWIRQTAAHYVELAARHARLSG